MKVKIKGPIISSDEKWIYDFFGIESTSPKEVIEAVEKANGDELVVEINSGGGDVYAGSEIYTALKEYSGEVTTKITGIAASAASVIVMAGDKALMSPTAQMMIHNVSAVTYGDYRDMKHSSEVLKNANETIANSYMLKSGMERKELLKMMDKETWLTPKKALEHNLIDEVMFDKKMKLTAGINSNLLPRETIEKMREMKDKLIPTDNESDFLMQKQRAKLNLLKPVSYTHLTLPTNRE